MHGGLCKLRLLSQLTKNPSFVRAFQLEPFANVSIVPLALFRIVFGIVMTLQFQKFWQVFSLDLITRSYFLKYDLFEWVVLPSPELITPLFLALIIASLCFTIGVFFRAAAFVQFLGMMYCFLIEKSLYNNHYYLFILLCFLMLFTNADGAFAIKGKPVCSVKNWQLLMIRLQIFILYFFGGIAKLNHDWIIEAQPVKLWLPDMLGPFFGTLYADSFAYLIAYSGLLIDLSVGFLLFSKRWKWLAIIILVVFHGTNMLMFSIGYFPLFGILSLVVFLDLKEIKLFFPSVRIVETEGRTTVGRPIILIGLAFWFSFQILVPLRHYILPGRAQWEMNGYLFSWYMKLNDYAPLLRFEVQLPNEAGRFTFDMSALSESPQQRHYIATYPFLAVQFAKDIESYFKKTNNMSGDIKVFCDSYVSLNGRPFQRKINPNKDLTSIDLSPVGKFFHPHDWILPLGDLKYVDKTVVYRLRQFERTME